MADIGWAQAFFPRFHAGVHGIFPKSTTRTEPGWRFRPL